MTSSLSLRARLDESVASIAAHTPRRADVALILGSGLGSFADNLTDAVKIPFSEIRHMPHTSVAGHAGKLVIGGLHGLTVAALQGRVHMYEGHSAAEAAYPARILRHLGAKVLIVTNASGGVRPTFLPGTFMLMTDHIDLLRDHALRGPNDDSLGPRFPDMTHAYHPKLRELAKQASATCGIPLEEGVYAAMPGPTYETPAEVRMLRQLGADATGMSTVPEVVVANHMGAAVLGISCITNQAAGLSPHALTHKEVTDNASAARERFARLLDQILRDLAKTDILRTL